MFEKIFLIEGTAFLHQLFRHLPVLLEDADSGGGLFGGKPQMMKNFAEIVRGKENPYGYDYELRLFELVMQACGK